MTDGQTDRTELFVIVNVARLYHRAYDIVGYSLIVSIVVVYCMWRCRQESLNVGNDRRCC